MSMWNDTNQWIFIIDIRIPFVHPLGYVFWTLCLVVVLNGFLAFVAFFILFFKNFVFNFTSILLGAIFLDVSICKWAFCKEFCFFWGRRSDFMSVDHFCSWICSARFGVLKLIVFEFKKCFVSNFWTSCNCI